MYNDGFNAKGLKITLLYPCNLKSNYLGFIARYQLIYFKSKNLSIFHKRLTSQ